MAAFTVAACTGSSPVAPPAVNNTPPVIESLAVAGQRAEADRPIQVTASVRDTETQASQLTYTWSASPRFGTFTGTGATTTWRPPKGETTPDLYTITLTVTESFTSSGQARTNVVSSSTTVHYNDSPAETAALATQFIRDFGTSSMTPEQCVRNFSDTGHCADEKAAERDQVEANRENFQILGAIMLPETIAFDDAMTAGSVEGPCQFEDIPRSGPNAGRREFVSGTCRLTTVYENFRWFLCASNFLPPFNTTLASLRGRVPGRPFVE